MLGATGLYSARASSVEAVVPRVPLAALPLALGDWHGREAAPLADDVLAQLGVDDYVNRQYTRAGAPPVGVYVGYYASQRQGDTIHSPQNCLPGAGWLPTETTVTPLRAGDRSVPVNQFVIQKALDRQVVLYLVSRPRQGYRQRVREQGLSHARRRAPASHERRPRAADRASDFER